MNRLARERVKTGIVAACAAVALATVVWWAWGPITAAPVVLDGPHQESAPQIAHAPPMDASVYDQNLWHVPPQGSSPAAEQATTIPTTPPPTPPATINLTLVAIVQDDRDGGRWRAALYDPVEQRLVLAASDDRVGRVIVREVTDRTVLLELSGRERLLALEDGAP